MRRPALSGAIVLPFVCLLLLGAPRLLLAQHKFYNYYDDGQKYAKKGDWQRALDAFQSAASLEFEDTNKKRTYGTRFIKYFPHREMGIAYYNLVEYENARQELELSLAYKKSKEAQRYLSKLEGGEPPPPPAEPEPAWNKALVEALGTITDIIDIVPVEAPAVKVPAKPTPLPVSEPEEPEEEPTPSNEPEPMPETVELLLHAEAAPDQPEEAQPGAEPETPVPLTETAEPAVAVELAAPAPSLAHVPELNYDPSKIIQVGSRLSLAVLPFEDKGEAQDLGATITEVLVAELVNLRRFKVLERAAMAAVISEQDMAMLGMVEESSAAQAGKIAGADVIVMGSIHLAAGYSQISMRLIDTETSETITALEAQTAGADLRSLQQLIKRASVLIYNELPLKVGYIVNVDADQIYLDLGSEAGVRKGSKCVAFTEGSPIIHPVTGEVLGTKVAKLGELLVVQVQERLSVGKLILDEGEQLKVGDRVVTK